MKILKVLIYIAIIIIVAWSCFADEVQIPFSCYPKEIQAKFLKAGKQLDLNGDDRKEDSWGFIENKGTHYNIITYKQITPEDLQEIQKIIMEK